MFASVHVRQLVWAASVVFLLLLAYWSCESGLLSSNESFNAVKLEVPKPAEAVDKIKDTEAGLFGAAGSPVAGDKVIVIGRLEKENTSWVQDFLPDWQNAIYTVDNTSAVLHTPQNKGREANAYLLYIIQNYHNLPSTIAFLHPHRDGYPGGWHTDAANHDNVIAMKTLNIDFVQRNGYANLRCNWVPGCPDEVQTLRSPDDYDPANIEHQMPEVWHDLFGPSSVVPEIIATPCCAQFAVSRDQVLKRPLEDYQKYHQWVMDTPKDDHLVGLFFEYLWHIIFGMDAVYCPDMMQCYSDVYGS